MKNEEKFYEKLNEVFTGAKIEGTGGFINLLKIKWNYYQKISAILRKDIDERLTGFEDFREDLFLKLYNFFDRYFTESGSIYFDRTAYHNNVYEKVYTDERDVILFWKTHMLYYVKTDRIFRSMPVALDGPKFYFDASKLEHKKANERKGLIYNLIGIKEDGVIQFEVKYKEGNKITKNDEVLKKLRKEGTVIKEEDLEKAFKIFEKQSEVDFFINKSAKEFLKEQYKLWIYQYMFDEENIWNEKRIKELQILKETAYDIIDYVSQFEDELVMIWNKPKFVRNSNYVVTLDRLVDKNGGKETINKILRHGNFDEQAKEWKELGIVNESFQKTEILTNENDGDILNTKYKTLPVDTKYFKDIELEIIGLFENLDKSLDGWLIRSENYQALNTIRNKFKGIIQTIYIDPPFNLDSSDQFLYRTNYKDSNWATLLENRILLSKDFLDNKGNIFVRCDYHGNWIVRCLLDSIWNRANLRNELIVNRISKKGFANRDSFEPIKYPEGNDFLFFYANSPNSFFNFVKIESKSKKEKWHSLDVMDVNPRSRPRIIMGKEMLAPEGRKWMFTQENIYQMEKDGLIRLNSKGVPQYKVGNQDFELLDSKWTDIPGYSSTTDFATENSEKLLDRVIRTGSKIGGFIFDYFLGSGTTTSVAQKLQRRWIGVEMGNCFVETALPRMKEVLSGKSNREPCGISNMVDWKGGGFFKYYELEQYEETLKNCKYKDGDIFERPGEKPFNEYVFMKDEKLLSTIQIDYDKGEVKVDLIHLYNDIDVAETLSNLTGKWIKAIHEDEVEFDDGTKINTKKLDYKLIKPLLWWQKNN